MKNYKYQYETIRGTCRGFFNIYQAMNGKIYLQLGDNITPLTLDQVEDLGINVYELISYSQDDFEKAYNKALKQ